MEVSPGFLARAQNMSSQAGVPTKAAAAILQPSHPVWDNAVPVHGPDFEHDMTLETLLASYQYIGFQATGFGQAIDIVNQMVHCGSVTSRWNS